MGRDDHHGRVGCSLAQARQEVEGIAVGQPPVQDDDLVSASEESVRASPIEPAVSTAWWSISRMSRRLARASESSSMIRIRPAGRAVSIGPSTTGEVGSGLSASKGGLPDASRRPCIYVPSGCALMVIKPAPCSSSNRGPRSRRLFPR